jgi:hypothetical protein
MNWPARSKAQPPRSAGMFVWHAPAPSGNRRVGHQSTKDAPGLFDKVPPLEFRPITTFASETAVASKPLVFLTVVAPTLGSHFNPETFAQSIIHDFSENSADLRCRFENTDLHFKVVADGARSVERP